MSQRPTDGSPRDTSDVVVLEGHMTAYVYCYITADGEAHEVLFQTLEEAFDFADMANTVFTVLGHDHYYHGYVGTIQ